MPDSHNAGDFGQSLIGADHDYGVETEADLEKRTDGHMDISEVRAGATLICPVEIDGGGGVRRRPPREPGRRRSLSSTRPT